MVPIGILRMQDHSGVRSTGTSRRLRALVAATVTPPPLGVDSGPSPLMR